MFLKIRTLGENADKISYIIGKNPNNLFVSNERSVINNVQETELGKIIKHDGSFIDIWNIDKELLTPELKKYVEKDTPETYAYLVRNGNLNRKKLGNAIETYLFFKKYEPEECEVVLFSVPNPIIFGKDFEGYVNEREYLISSIFMMEVNDNLRSAFTKEGDIYDTVLNFEFEIGPIKPKLAKKRIISLFENAGFEIECNTCNEKVSFDIPRDEVVFLALKTNGIARDIMKKLFVLINTVDNFTYFKPNQDNFEKIKRYINGWVETHPMRNLIINRNLSYTSYANQLIKEIEEKEEEKPNDEVNLERKIDLSYGENGETLNETRMRTMKELVLKNGAKKVLDMGCGEGNLLKLLGFENFEKVVGIDSSSKCVALAKKNLKTMEDKNKETFKVPEVFKSSLYYKDSRLKGFDTIVLCEVIEHIDYIRIFEVIDNIMWLEPKTFILSTPNKEFNKFFKNGELMKNGLRHYDHRFEFTKDEFVEFVKSISEKYGYIYEIIDYGKEIENIKPTMAVIFKREEI